MSQSTEAQRLSAFLRMFKSRMDRSYEALARRSGVSSSALHRYCAGTSVPADYGPVQRFARECGATQPELRELHRLWALADASRRGQPERVAQPKPEQPPRMPDQGTPPLMLVAMAALAAVAGAAAWWVSFRAVPATGTASRRR